jgi:hypothetical protein
MQRAGSWQPRASTVAVALALAFGAAGVGWAATRGAAPGVISACANADNVLSLSTSGGCPSGQTLVTWNAVGPQGPPGQQGAPGVRSGPTALGFVRHQYNGAFTIAAALTNPGSYVVSGSAYAKLNGSPSGPIITIADHTPRCELLSGAPNASASLLADWSFTFHHLKNPSRWTPQSLTGPVDVNAALDVTAEQTPVEVYFSCNAGGGTGTWTDPMITVEQATSSTFHPTVGPALPNRRVIGPGTLRKLLGPR